MYRRLLSVALIFAGTLCLGCKEKEVRAPDNATQKDESATQKGAQQAFEKMQGGMSDENKRKMQSMGMDPESMAKKRAEAAGAPGGGAAPSAPGTP